MKFLTLTVVMTLSIQSFGMSRLSRFTSNISAKLATTRTAMATRVQPMRKTMAANPLFARFSTAAKAQPVKAKFYTRAAFTGATATMAAWTLNAKPARAEGPKPEAPKPELTLSQRVEAGLNSALAFCLATFAPPTPQAPAPKVEAVAQSVKNEKATTENNGVIRSLNKEDVDKALAIGKSLYAQAKQAAQLEAQRRQYAYYQCKADAIKNRELFKISSYSEACRLCAFRSATSYAYYPSSDLTQKEIEAANEIAQASTASQSFLFPKAQQQLEKNQSEAARIAQAIEEAKAYEASQKKVVIEPSAPALDAQDKADFAKMAAELMAEQNNTKK
jgi:hypothetical protein